MIERKIGERFLDGRTQLIVVSSENGIGCNGCYYNKLRVMKEKQCGVFEDKNECSLAKKKGCKSCMYEQQVENKEYICDRNAYISGYCSSGLRSDGINVIFMEVACYLKSR